MPVINQVYSASEFTSGKQAHEIVKAWNRCLEQVIKQFLADVALLI